MNVTAIMQQILDETLLPFGVLSNHLRRVEADNIANSQVEVNGDGKAKTRRVYIDVNYYYLYEKTDPRYSGIDERLKAIKRAVLQDPHFAIANDESDIPDSNNPYRGVNIEFVYIGAVDYG